MDLRRFRYEIVQFGLQRPYLCKVLFVLRFPADEIGDETVPTRLLECREFLLLLLELC
ncbi:hypothetical protein HMPREF0620_0119 [Parascardovia denticolens DSM 10105 = JCM 12538]|uniref:Uncharacterized protein n=1 Tax=Parascardovia denticolens DSM 10105 = JCM 12538 TaxID=864564 RepID=E6JZ20_PARDN|nr:hypothetical protein HMPREF0620_0119 [Parascardovia denticolens DSM 10105 = JCM 12538]